MEYTSANFDLKFQKLIALFRNVQSSRNVASLPTLSQLIPAIFMTLDEFHEFSLQLHQVRLCKCVSTIDYSVSCRLFPEILRLLHPSKVGIVKTTDLTTIPNSEQAIANQLWSFFRTYIECDVLLEYLKVIDSKIEGKEFNRVYQLTKAYMISLCSLPSVEEITKRNLIFDWYLEDLLNAELFTGRSFVGLVLYIKGSLEQRILHGKY